jgi:hypothetical protein
MTNGRTLRLQTHLAFGSSLKTLGDSCIEQSQDGGKAAREQELPRGRGPLALRLAKETILEVPGPPAGNGPAADHPFTFTLS